MVIENPISGEVVATWPKISVEERLDVLQGQLPALDAYTTYKFLSEAERDAFWDDGPNSAITTDAKEMSLLEHSQICNIYPLQLYIHLFYSTRILSENHHLQFTNKQGKDVILSLVKHGAQTSDFLPSAWRP